MEVVEQDSTAITIWMMLVVLLLLLLLSLSCCALPSYTSYRCGFCESVGRMELLRQSEIVWRESFDDWLAEYTQFTDDDHPPLLDHHPQPSHSNVCDRGGWLVVE